MKYLTNDSPHERLVGNAESGEAYEKEQSSCFHEPQEMTNDQKPLRKRKGKNKMSYDLCSYEHNSIQSGQTANYSSC